MSALVRIVTAAAIGGLVVGAAIGIFTADDAEPGTLALDAVTVYACPGVGEVGTLHRGDRILVTGRSGDWLAVRNVRGSGERVFVAGAAIVPDADLSGLPEVDCDQVGILTVAATETTVPEETTTTTAAPDDSTTTSSSTTSSTTTSSTTTTTAPDTTPPSMSNAGASPSTIWELNGVATCGANPRQATISVNVTDAGSGVSTVTATWNDPLGGHANVLSRSGNTYSFTFGNYPEGTFPTNAPNYTHTVTVTLTAVDQAGNDQQTAVQVTVTETDQCFG